MGRSPNTEPVSDEEIAALRRAAEARGDQGLAAVCVLALAGSAVLEAAAAGTELAHLRETGMTQAAARLACEVEVRAARQPTGDDEPSTLEFYTVQPPE